MILHIEGNDQDRQAAQELLQEQGFTVSLQREDRPNSAAQEDLPLAFLEPFIDGIVIFDVETAGVLYANRAFAEMLGYSLEEVRRHKIWDWDVIWSREEFQQMYATRNWLEERFETRFRRKDGQVLDVAVTHNPITWKGKEVIFCVARDISERKKTERVLQLMQFTVEKTGDQAFWLTPEGQITYANNAACVSLGYRREELVGLSLYDIDSDCCAAMVAESWDSLKKDKVRRFERFHKARDGRIYPVEIRSNYVNYDGREFRFAFVIDISERKEAEAALRRSEEQYRQLMDMLPIAAYTTDAEGRITFFNRKAQEFWQRKPRLGSDLWCGSHMLRNLDGSPMAHDQCPMALTLKAGQVCQGKEIIVEHPDGSRSNVIAYPERLMDAAGKTEGAVNLLVDITERRQTEEALSESERKYRSIVEHAPFGITRSTREGKLINANPAFASILGYDSVQELLETVNRSNIQDVLFPEPSKRAPLVENILSSDSWHVFNNVFFCKAGSLVTCRVHSRRILDKAGRASAFESYQENITDQVEAERALRDSEEKFRVLAETSPVAICIFQGERYIYANPAMERLSGYSVEELSRMPLWAWVHKDDKERVRSRALARLAGESVPCQYEFKGVTSRGAELYILVSAGTMEHQGRTTVVATFLDITERKHSEELVRASLTEKEVLLKEIHHRVKNNLQVVSSLLFLQSQKFNDPELQACFLESQSRICSMALAHEQLYQSKNLAEVSIRNYVESLVEQLQRIFLLPDQQEIDCRLVVEDLELDIAKVVPCGLLITELLSNAYKHAFVDGRSGQVTISLQRSAGQIELSVADDGVGLPAEFDYRQATTLGLQLVTALANQLGGTLEVERDVGTRFQVSFAE